MGCEFIIYYKSQPTIVAVRYLRAQFDRSAIRLWDGRFVSSILHQVLVALALFYTAGASRFMLTTVETRYQAVAFVFVAAMAEFVTSLRGYSRFSMSRWAFYAWFAASGCVVAKWLLEGVNFQ